MLNYFSLKKATMIAIYTLTASICLGRSLQQEVDSLNRLISRENDIKKQFFILKRIGERNVLMLNRADYNSTLTKMFCIAFSVDNSHDKEELLHRLFNTIFENKKFINVDTVSFYLGTYRSVTEQIHTTRCNMRLLLNEARLANLKHKTDSATTILLKLTDRAADIDPETLVESLLLYGGILEEHGNKIEALKKYANAVLIAQKLDAIALINRCYYKLGHFYEQTTNDEMALIYFKKIGNNYIENKETDSNLICENLTDIYVTSYKSQFTKNYVSDFRKIIDFAKKNGNGELKEQIFSVYRTYLIKSLMFHDLYELYHIDFIDEYERLKTEDTTTYYRISAFMEEGVNHYDSAEYFYQMAEKRITKESENYVFVSNFLKRFGEFYLRHHELDKAKSKFFESINYSAKVRYIPYIVENTRYLDSIYELEQDYKNAYKYSKINKLYTDSFVLINQNTEINQLVIKNEENLLNFENEKEKLQTAIRNQIMLAGISLGALILFTISLLIYRNLRKQKHFNELLNREKKRSDELLLNVLPAEVAEELKEKGYADAKHFDGVTVLFTDFKDFTLVTEKLAPQELVNELHACFKAFDEIVSRHGIEKIKTVGDAYIAAAGVPVADDRHAVKVVAAAIDIMQFMRERRRLLGEKSFEIRIGINTGSVVAGIVGVKKFAYDIWGDAVNIAARMEQNCETGRINISESTFNLVHQKYACYYRGEIDAKNKGMLKMYYIKESVAIE